MLYIFGNLSRPKTRKNNPALTSYSDYKGLLKMLQLMMSKKKEILYDYLKRAQSVIHTQ